MQDALKLQDVSIETSNHKTLPWQSPTASQQNPSLLWVVATPLVTSPSPFIPKSIPIKSVQQPDLGILPTPRQTQPTVNSSTSTNILILQPSRPLTTCPHKLLWNDPDSEEQLLQVAGHLKSRALQEWNLLVEVARDNCKKKAVKALDQVDSGSKVMAA